MEEIKEAKIDAQGIYTNQCQNCHGAKGEVRKGNSKLKDLTIEQMEEALKDSVYSGLKVGGVAWAGSIVAAQLGRTGMEQTLRGVTDYLVKNILTCIVGLPELSIVRIGTIWKNQVRQDSYWNKYALYEEQIPLSFNLEKIPAKCIIYKKNDSDKKNLQECNIEDLHSKNSLEFDYDENYYASTFVKFTTKDGISYIVPSIELLMSTYLPRNKLIRNELILNPMNTLLQSYILDYSCTEDEYNIELDKALEKETMVFLAYMMCDKKSKGNISKIWTSLENTHSSGLKYPFILPYHPKNISFRVSGIWIKDKLFYVQRIYEPEAPNEIRVNIKCTRTISTNDKYEENEVEDLGDGNNKDKPLNTNPINKPVNITPRDNPGGNVGVKHIVSEVSPNNNQLNCDVDEEVVIIKNENNNKYKKTDVEVDGASSGKLSGKEGSKRIARTIYTVEENPKEIIYIKEVTDALEILKNNGYPLIDEIYVSSELNKSKKRGDIYHIIKEKYKNKKIIYAFEELENNLHPALQRKLFEYIYKLK